MNRPEILENWLNPMYEPNPGVIWPSVAPISIRLWKQLYLSQTSACPWNDFIPCVKHIKQNYCAVKKVANQLRTQIRRALDDLATSPDTSCEGEIQQEQLPCLAQLKLESQDLNCQ